MAKRSVPQPVEPDVLVLGQHPSAYFAASLLCAKPSPLRVMHATIPGELWPERLCLLNPKFYSLHPLLGPLKRKLAGVALAGAKFLSDDPQTASEHRGKAAMAQVVSLPAAREALAKVARDQGVHLLQPRTLEIHELNEKGIHVSLGDCQARPKALVLCGSLPPAQEKMLGLPDSWDREALRRYTWCLIKDKAPGHSAGTKPMVPMSLDLRGLLAWGWAIPGDGLLQLAVSQPAESVGTHPPLNLLKHWLSVLHAHGCAAEVQSIPADAVQSMDMPAAGALMHEGVANRTLLVGPAGGFYSACGEDLYPNCWSAVHAADCLKKALKEPHLQDAIEVYRRSWRTTLGEYLRGPQQNLRYLLPLIYRNQVMTTRLAEAILEGKSIVR